MDTQSVVKHSLTPLLLGTLLAGGYSLASPSPSVTQTPQKAALTLVKGMTGNAQGSRDHARTLRADSDKLLAAKDYNGAMEKRLAILDIRPKVFAGLGALGFYATQSLAIGDLSAVASHLNASSCRKYADQLEALDAQIPSYARILQTQKADELKTISTYTSNLKDWNHTTATWDFTPQERQTLTNTSVAQLEFNIVTVYDAEARRSTQPYSTTQAPLPASIDPYTRMIAEPLHMGQFLWTRNKTARILAIVALRQRADYLEKKTRAWSLPFDPFGRGPLKEKGTTFYSVGPDTRDDGGKAVPSFNLLEASDVGDLIAPAF